MTGMLAGTQQPLFDQGEKARAVADFQGAIESYNFALSADPDMKSSLTPRILFRRAQCHHQLGDAHQASSDLRLALGLASPTDVWRGEAEALQAKLAKP